MSEGSFLVFVSLIETTHVSSSYIIITSSNILIYFVIHPVMHSADGFTLDLVASGISINFMVLFLFTVVMCLITFKANLIAEKNRAKEECAQLLHWIKNGVLLQKERGDQIMIKFSNKVS